jgi:ketosteroid isomerase-like protein
VSEQQNTTLIQQAFEAFGRGDIPAILDRCSADCEFYFPGPSTIPYTGTKKGKAEIRTYFDVLTGTQSDINLAIDKFVAQDDTVVAIGRYSAIVTATRKTIDTPIVLTFTVQDGKITRHMVLGDSAAVAESYTTAAAAAR